MSRGGNTSYTQPVAGDWVRHPLYPELGVGLVLTAPARSNQPATRCGKIRWANDQLSTHCLGILRLATQPVFDTGPSHDAP